MLALVITCMRLAKGHAEVQFSMLSMVPKATLCQGTDQDPGAGK